MLLLPGSPRRGGKVRKAMDGDVGNAIQLVKQWWIAVSIPRRIFQEINVPPQQNLWGDSGSGSRPKL